MKRHGAGVMRPTSEVAARYTRFDTTLCKLRVAEGGVAGYRGDGVEDAGLEERKAEG